jgi:hypothetical protein
VRIGDGETLSRITDRDRPPLIQGVDTVVTRSATDVQATAARFVLSRPSGKHIPVVVATRLGTADATDYVPVRSRAVLAPGTRRLRLDVSVLPDPDGLSPTDESFTVEVVRARRVRIGRPAAVTIRPPEPATEARVAPLFSGRTMHRQ